MPPMNASLSAHKKTVVIRPQIHNGFLPTIRIVAFRYSRASVDLIADAEQVAVEFGEPHHANVRGLTIRSNARRKKAVKWGRYLTALTRQPELPVMIKVNGQRPFEC